MRSAHDVARAPRPRPQARASSRSAEGLERRGDAAEGAMQVGRGVGQTRVRRGAGRTRGCRRSRFRRRCGRGPGGGRGGGKASVGLPGAPSSAGGARRDGRPSRGAGKRRAAWRPASIGASSSGAASDEFLQAAAQAAGAGNAPLPRRAASGAARPSRSPDSSAKALSAASKT
jgi:hypothetical protein